MLRRVRRTHHSSGHQEYSVKFSGGRGELGLLTAMGKWNLEVIEARWQH